MDKASRKLRRLELVAATTIGLAASGLGAGRAHADGAFPDSQGLMLPSDRPNEIMLATNFGVVISEDGGQTWTYSCERMANGATASLYQITAAPRDRIMAITSNALIYSDDRACGWGMAQGMLAGKAPLDFFPDGTSANRVWAVRRPDSATAPYTVVESTDGGSTFTTVRFTATVGDSITGVELSRSDTNTAYVTLRNTTTFAPKLAVTKNGGTSWDTRDLTAQLGNTAVRIISIDPTNAGKIFLRVSGSNDAGSVDGIALSLDGGASFVSPSPITVPGGVLTSFVRMPSGTLLIGGVDQVRNVIFRSTNGGTTFTEIDAPLVKGLGQRNGRLFLASTTDDNGNGYALGESTDEGTSWKPLMRFDQIQAISSCAKAICHDDCQLKADIGVWDDATCTADPMPMPVDGSAPADASPARDAAAGDGALDSKTTTTESGGCHCAATGRAGDTERFDTFATIVISLCLAAARRRRPRARRSA